ncbi:hypothetical protein BTJ68_12839 [Hortaea werneckii EXF-2000]|uniref:DNA-directed DNA polymerase n=1 Tax=Hortaea werneckii EXF-2000 TaxID=1157616 RepID=A0A1Z5SZ55_HORWE|nr:hypothetical protein BTJ68_12839 [Hortaea werneckii EXF-2000]
MAAMNGKSDDTLLKTPDTDTEYPPQERATSTYMPHPTYRLPKGDERHYQQQYADMYFARLVQLKPAVEQIAREPFDAIEIGGEQCRRVERVLDVRQGELCWVIGTIYMEMPLKPNVLEDIGKEHWIAAPPPRVKYDSGAGLAVEGAHGAHAAGTGGAGTQIMLEDESGRLRLVGSELGGFMLVTGAIVAVVGTENKDGDFEVLDLRVPDLPRQPQRWETEDGEAALKGEKVATQDREKAGKLALVSGLGISGDEGDSLTLDLLLEYLLGEAATPKEQETAAGISRLIIAGNALSQSSPIPTPTTPKASDEVGWLDSQTNPADLSVDGWRLLGNGGQPLDDVYKYIPNCENRLDMMEAMLRWRLTAPTAPDTLWCYPFQDGDAFVMKECPHLFFVGNQPKFETTVIEGPVGQQVRLVAVPNFKDTGEVVLIDMETLVPEVIKFDVFEG